MLLFYGAPWASLTEPEQGARQLGKSAGFLCLLCVGKSTLATQRVSSPWV